jgi:hypothetical protein
MALKRLTKGVVAKGAAKLGAKRVEVSGTKANKRQSQTAARQLNKRVPKRGSL